MWSAMGVAACEGMMGGGNKWLKIGLRERERERIKKIIFVLAFGSVPFY